MNNQTYSMLLLEDGLPIEERLNIACEEAGQGATRILREHLNSAWFTAIPVDERALLESIKEYAEREVKRLVNIDPLTDYDVRVSIEGYPDGRGAPNVKLYAKKVESKQWPVYTMGYTGAAAWRAREDEDDRLPFIMNTRYGEPVVEEGQGRYRVAERMTPMVTAPAPVVARFGP